MLIKFAKRLDVSLDDLLYGIVERHHLAPIVERFSHSPFARQLQPPLEVRELAWLDKFPDISWDDRTPTEMTVFHLVYALRAAAPRKSHNGKASIETRP